MSDFSAFEEDRQRKFEQDPEAFDFEIGQDTEGMFRVVASRDGEPSSLMTLEWATSYADRIRRKHPKIADHIDGCVEQGKRYAAYSYRV